MSDKAKEVTGVASHGIGYAPPVSDELYRAAVAAEQRSPPPAVKAVPDPSDAVVQAALTQNSAGGGAGYKVKEIL